MSDHTTLTDTERDSLTECECGHYLNEHSSEGCLATVYDGDDGMASLDDVCACMATPDVIRERAIVAIVAARVAAAEAAARAEHVIPNRSGDTADTAEALWQIVEDIRGPELKKGSLDADPFAFVYHAMADVVAERVATARAEERALIAARILAAREDCGEPGPHDGFAQGLDHGSNLGLEYAARLALIEEADRG